VIAPALVSALRAEYHAELGQPRQLARFLCGLTSPATTRAKLSRHQSYGALAAHRFADVLSAVSQDSRAPE
jgi:ATP-dependent DNA helicase RecQ